MVCDCLTWLLTVTFLSVLSFFRPKCAPKKVGGGGCAYKLAEHGYLSLREREVVARAIRSGMDAGCSTEEIKALALATLSLERERRSPFPTLQEAV